MSNAEGITTATARSIREMQEALSLSDHGLTRSQLADAIGKSYEHVGKLLRRYPAFFNTGSGDYNGMIQANTDNIINVPTVSLYAHEKTTSYNYHEDFEELGNVIADSIRGLAKTIKEAGITGQHIQQADKRALNPSYEKALELVSEKLKGQDMENIAQQAMLLIQTGLLLEGTAGKLNIANLIVMHMAMEHALDIYGDKEYSVKDEVGEPGDTDKAKEYLDKLVTKYNKANAG